MVQMHLMILMKMDIAIIIHLKFATINSDLYLIPLVVSLFHIDRCIDSNSEPEKCCPIKRTIGSLSS